MSPFRPDPDEINAQADAMTARLGEILARIATKGQTGRYVVLLVDPQLPTSGQNMSAYGPFDGPQATTVAEALRHAMVEAEAGDVEVLIVPWLKFGV